MWLNGFSEITAKYITKSAGGKVTHHKKFLEFDFSVGLFYKNLGNLQKIMIPS